MAEERVYKVQCDSRGVKVLIYDQTREHRWEGYPPKGLLKDLRLRNLTKRYFYGTLDEEGKIQLDPAREVTEPQAGF